MNTFLDQRVLERLRAEYLEMPGMKLRIEQVQRLCGIEPTMCTLVLDALVKAGFSMPDVRRDVRAVDRRRGVAPTPGEHGAEGDAVCNDVTPRELRSMRRAESRHINGRTASRRTPTGSSVPAVRCHECRARQRSRTREPSSMVSVPRLRTPLECRAPDIVPGLNIPLPNPHEGLMSSLPTCRSCPSHLTGRPFRFPETASGVNVKGGRTAALLRALPPRVTALFRRRHGQPDAAMAQDVFGLLRPGQKHSHARRSTPDFRET